MNRSRLFIGIPLPDTARRALYEQTRRAVEHRDSALRLVPARNYHITVRFLGDTDESRIAGIARATRAATSLFRGQGVTDLSSSIDRWGVFPPRKQPRVFWAGIGHGIEQLGALEQLVSQALETIGIDRDPKGFQPHVTVSYVRRKQNAAFLRELSGQLFSTPIEFRLEALTLFRSVLERSGARYEALMDSPLS
jgi:2'-5' RNA ligase